MNCVNKLESIETRNAYCPTVNSALPLPSPANDYHADHIERLCRSFQHWLGRSLIDPNLSRSEAARLLYTAPYAVLSHTPSADPVFNYANQTAQQLFDMDWLTLTTLPSRLSAEPVNQEERERLLSRVRRQGYIDDYRGIRISRTGQRFWIENAIVWNLLDANGDPAGQAAMFDQWRFITG